ncbi:hypothetical protein Acr_16g0008480 [Actinidia rufa]|uniref:Retrotransposon gag domain-containing protein n=1 Tax=Actinidia rufa TaxID=165716 RepID=A0A7J0G066_9ERIC|nr:hypothetical protein Acr_16g0008480 [Actinidia rufa]
MDNTRGSGQEGGNENPQMTELRNMVQMLVGAVTAQQQLLQQHFQPPQPQETRELDLSRAETQQGETSEYRGVTEDPVIPMESVAVKNFRLLRCGEQQKVEIGSYLLAGEASRWWNLKGVREPGMDWARFKVIFREKFVPRAVQNAKCSEFEHLKQLGTTILQTMRGRSLVWLRFIRPLVLPTYAEVLDRAIIVEQDEIERNKYFDSKRRQNFGGEGTSGQKKQKPEMKSRNFGNNPKGQVQRNCPRLRTEAVAPRGGPGAGNARLGAIGRGTQGTGMEM